MGTRILRGPVVKERADLPDSTGAGDHLRGTGDIEELPEGVIRLSDPRVRATTRDGPLAVAYPIAHRGRVTWLDAREKGDGGRLLRAAVAAVTREQRFLERPTIGGPVLWVSEVAAADIKGQLAEVAARLDKVFFIRGLKPDTNRKFSLARLAALLRPIWVIIDPWRHYLQVQRVTVGELGAEKLLLGDLVDWARESETAVTVSHDNEKDRPGAYTHSAVLGTTDMVVSLGPGKSPATDRLQPSGRWRVDPVDICWSRGLGYPVVKDAEQGSRSIDERVVLHLLERGADVRPPARELGAKLACGGRRYVNLKKALSRLLAEGIVDHAQRSGASSGRGRGYALTERGRLRAECLRQTSDSEVSTNSAASVACSDVGTVSKRPFPAVRGNGNEPTPFEAASASCSAVASVSEGALPAVGGNGNEPTPFGAASAEGCSETVSEAASPAVGGSENEPTPGGEVSASCSEAASVSGRAGDVGVVGDGWTEPASRRSCTPQLEDLLLRLLRSHGAGEPRLMFRTILALFRQSGHSVEGVGPALNRLVADGLLQKIPSQYYPEPLYALTERGRHRVAGSKDATASEHP